LYTFIPMTRESMNKLSTYDVALPGVFIVFRPHQRYLTETVVKTKEGALILFGGNEQAKIVGDINQRTSCSITATTGVAVPNPDHIYTARNCLVTQGLGGAGCAFYDPSKKRELSSSVRYYDPDNGNFGTDDESLFVTFVPPNIRNMIPNTHHMDITGHSVTLSKMNIISKEEYQTNMYPTSYRMSHEWGWNRSDSAGYQIGRVTNRSTGNSINYNTTVHAQTHWKYNPVTKSHDIAVQGSAHWETLLNQDGCRSARHGALGSDSIYKR
jgi:hypothetical protein